MLSRKVTKTEVINSVDEQFLTADLHEMEELEEISKKVLLLKYLKLLWEITVITKMKRLKFDQESTVPFKNISPLGFFQSTSFKFKKTHRMC